MSMHQTTVASLFAKCITTGGPDSCWPWTGRVPDRYGTISIENRPTPTHRAAYLLCVGDIPDGLFVCHRCDNTLCCNPRHLFLGTHQQNVDDCVTKQRHIHGERHPDAMLSEDEVREILSAKDGPRGTGRHLAQRFLVSPSTIAAIWSGRNWKHVSAHAVAMGM